MKTRTHTALAHMFALWDLCDIRTAHAQRIITATVGYNGGLLLYVQQ